MEEIKNFLIENNYVVRVLENNLTRLVGVKVINDKLINVYIYLIEVVSMNQQRIYINDKIKLKRLQHRYLTKLK